MQFVVGIGLFDAVNGERIGKLAGGRDDLGLFARELDLERINAAFLFALYFRAVRGEFYAVDVGIHFDQRVAARAVDKAFARDVQDRLGRPVRLVRVKTVLARFAIERDETFVVHAGLAALIARVCGEVKHIPHVRAPKIRVTLETLEHIFVIVRLIFFGVIAAFGMFGVQVRHAFRAVLGVGETALFIHRVVQLDP